MVAEPKISKKKKKVNVQNSPHMALQPLSSFYSARPDVLGHQTLEDFAQMCLSFVWRNFSLLDRFILFSACSSFFRNGVSFPRVSVRPLSLISWACKDRPGVIKLLDRTRRFVSLVFLATSLSRASIFCFRIFLLCSVLLSFFTHMGFFSSFFYAVKVEGKVVTYILAF